METVDMLAYKLSRKGVRPSEIPGLICDILKIIGDGGNFTVLMINKDLEHLGWNEGLFDQFTFELVLHLLQDVFDSHEVLETALH